MVRGCTRYLCCLSLSLAGWNVPARGATVTVEDWGKTASGQAVHRYHLRNGTSEAVLSDYGARIVALNVPDARGTVSNVVLGFDDVGGYEAPGKGVMAATIGRYANRIAGASITLDGASYALSKNNGKNTIHGGVDSFYTKVWTATTTKDGVRMTLDSPDGDMGFPGAMHVEVTFRLTVRKAATTMDIAYNATASKPTVINLTNHAYFNLGAPTATVNDDTAMVAASHYTPVDATGIPTGEVADVAGTPVDFRTPRTFALTMPTRGYDNNLVLDHPGLGSVAAEVHDSASGRSVRVYTTEPGVQLFVPQSQPATATAPARVAPHAFCLETQHFPDSPHHPNFPDTVLRPGKTFTSVTRYVFTAG